MTGRGRAWGRIAAILGAVLLCYPPHLLHSLLRRAPSPWIGRFLYLGGRCAGLRVTIAGAALDAPVLYASNHVSWLDILALGGARNSAFVSKAEVAGWPILGWLATIGETVFVERAARGAVQAQAAMLAAALSRGRPVTLFPEGTTGDGRSVRPFRPSLLAALAHGAVPVQPVALDYGACVPDVQWPEEEGAGVNALRVLGRRGRIDLTIRFLPPIDPAALDRKAIAARAEQAVADALIPRSFPEREGGTDRIAGGGGGLP